MGRAEKKSRLTRDAWLAKALDVLADDPEHLRLDEIARRLHVSKGSFYWHFENRSDFVRALAEYWRDMNTQRVADAIANHAGSPEERLLELMRMVTAERSAQYDLAVRAWARHEPAIVPVIEEVDEIRLKTVRALFESMGFEEPELGIRTRVFVVAQSFDQLLTQRLIPEEALDQVEARHAFFTRP